MPLYFGSNTVYVSAPRPQERQFESYSHRNIIYNNGKTQAAIRWCYVWNRDVTCQVTVTDEWGKTQALLQSDIGQFIFTPGGHYLAGSQQAAGPDQARRSSSYENRLTPRTPPALRGPLQPTRSLLSRC